MYFTDNHPNTKYYDYNNKNMLNDIVLSDVDVYVVVYIDRTNTHTHTRTHTYILLPIHVKVLKKCSRLRTQGEI